MRNKISGDVHGSAVQADHIGTVNLLFQAATLSQACLDQLAALVDRQRMPSAAPERRELRRTLPRVERSRCVGRSGELAALGERLAAGHHVLLCGPAGVGKTVLLNHAANTGVLTADAIAACEGMLWLSALGAGPDDVLKDLAYQCYDLKSPAESIRRLLDPVRALVVLDDVDWSPEQVREVLDAMPASVFVVTSRRADSARLLGLLPLAGLGLVDSLRLFDVPDDEGGHVERLWNRCDGNPRDLVRFATAIEVAGAQGLMSESADLDGNHLVVETLVSRSGEHAALVLRTLLVFPDVSWGADLLRRACGGDLSGVDRLVRGNLVGLEQDRYRVSENVVGVIDPLAGDEAVYRVTTWAITEANPEQVAAELGVVESVLRRMLAEQRPQAALVLARVVSVKLLPSLWWDRGDHVLRLGLRAAEEIGSRTDEFYFTYALAARRAADHRTGEAVELLIALIGSAGDDDRQIVDRACSLRAKLVDDEVLLSRGLAESPGLVDRGFEAASRLVSRVPAIGPLTRLVRDHPLEFRVAVAGVVVIAGVLVGLPPSSPAPATPAAGTPAASPAPIVAGLPASTTTTSAAAGTTSRTTPDSPSTTVAPSPTRRDALPPDLTGTWRLDFTRTDIIATPDRYTIALNRLDDTKCGTTPSPCFGGQWVHGDRLEGNKVAVAASPGPAGFTGTDVDVDDNGYQHYTGSLVTSEPLTYRGDWTTDDGKTATFVFTRLA